MISDDPGYPPMNCDPYVYDSYYSRYHYLPMATHNRGDDHGRGSNRYYLRSHHSPEQSHQSRQRARKDDDAEDGDYLGPRHLRHTGQDTLNIPTDIVYQLPDLSMQGTKREREADGDPAFLPPAPGAREDFSLQYTFSNSDSPPEDFEPLAKKSKADTFHPSQITPYFDNPSGFPNMEDYVTADNVWETTRPSIGFTPDIDDSQFAHFNPNAAFAAQMSPPHGSSSLERAVSHHRHYPQRERPGPIHLDDIHDDDDRKPAALHDLQLEEVRAAAARAARRISTRTTTSFAARQSDSPEMRTRGGERTSEISRAVPKHIGPSEREIEAAPNPRAEQALKVWYQRLKELWDYKNNFSHTNVPQKYEGNPPLGIWVNKQRCSRDSLSAEKRAALEAVGFDWGKKKGDYAWKEKYDELCRYKRIHGNCLVPTKCQDNPSLGRWVSTQRSQYKNYTSEKRTTMTEERVALLERIGFAWSMIEE